MKSSDLENTLREIEVDSRSSASHLARITLKLYHNTATQAQSTAELRQSLLQLSHQLRRVQPSITPIHNITAIITSTLSSINPETSIQESKRRIQQLLAHLDSHILTARGAIAKQAAIIIPEDATIITLSYSATVFDTLLHAYEQNPLRRVILSESRPLREGVKLARHLGARKIPVTLVGDAALPSLCGEADLVLVGADIVLPDGSVVHKIGTYPLSLAAHDQKKPFYVAADALKFQVKGVKYPFKIEEKPASEIVRRQRVPGVHVRNVYFDVTPARLITALITEFGVIRPPESTNIARRLFHDGIEGD